MVKAMKTVGTFAAAALSIAMAMPAFAPAMAASLSGAATITVQDYASHAPLAGATVQIADVRAQTDARGVAVLSKLPTDVQYIRVSYGDTYCAYNSGITIESGHDATRSVRLMRITAGQRAWLARVNAERAANGAPAVAFDETAQEAATEHARDMAERGYVSHWDTNGLKPYQRYARLGGVGVVDENVAGGFDSWAAAETAFMAERARRGSHYANIIDPTHRWVGLAEAHVRGNDTYDEEFVTMGAVFDPATVPESVSVGTPISIKFRSLGSQIFAAYGVEPLPKPLTTRQLERAPYDGSYDTVASIAYVPQAFRDGTLLETGSITLTRAGSNLLPVIGSETWLASVVVMVH